MGNVNSCDHRLDKYPGPGLMEKEDVAITVGVTLAVASVTCCTCAGIWKFFTECIVVRSILLPADEQYNWDADQVERRAKRRKCYICLHDTRGNMNSCCLFWAVIFGLLSIGFGVGLSQDPCYFPPPPPPPIPPLPPNVERRNPTYEVSTSEVLFVFYVLANIIVVGGICCGSCVLALVAVHYSVDQPVWR
jgi:hypothetical protein